MFSLPIIEKLYISNMTPQSYGETLSTEEKNSKMLAIRYLLSPDPNIFVPNERLEAIINDIRETQNNPDDKFSVWNKIKTYVGDYACHTDSGSYMLFNSKNFHNQDAETNNPDLPKTCITAGGLTCRRLLPTQELIEFRYNTSLMSFKSPECNYELTPALNHEVIPTIVRLMVKKYLSVELPPTTLYYPHFKLYFIAPYLSFPYLTPTN